MKKLRKIRSNIDGAQFQPGLAIVQVRNQIDWLNYDVSNKFVCCEIRVQQTTSPNLVCGKKTKNVSSTLLSAFKKLSTKK